MRIAVLVVLLGCGEIKEEDPIDAPRSIDSPALCSDMTSINSCGPSCALCPSTGDRDLPTCDGTVCGTTCNGDAPRCTDNSCSRTLFDFTSQTLQGATPRTPVGLTLAVRNFMGSQRLAIDVTSLTEVSFHVPVCLSGTGSFAARTLSAKVFFDGPPTTGGQFFVQASVPQPQSGAFLGTQSLDAGALVTYSSVMSMSTMSATTTNVTFQAGSFGAAFSGTIWFDDIKIE